MKKVILVYVVSTLGRTGPTRQLYNIVKYLDRNVFQAEVITLSPNPIPNLSRDFSELGAGVHSLMLSRFVGFTIGIQQLRNILKDLAPDIIHSQGLRADLLCAALNTFPARITTQRNIPFDDYPRLYPKLIGTMAAHMHCRALKKIPTIVTCSQDIANRNISKGILSIVIRNGIDVKDSGSIPVKNDKMSRRLALNLPTTGRLFVYAGPLISRKDPSLLIRAFLIHSDSLDALCLLGEGPLRSVCRRLAGGRRNILLPGNVTNVHSYLQAADFIVSASHSEGMPNAVLEGLAAGLPAILSDIPAHREIVQFCPEVGRLFPVGDPGALCNCFDQAVVDTADCLSARRLVENHFTAEFMSKSYQNLYSRTLGPTQ